MRNILLPTDFSENSKNAIVYALDFFKGESCAFIFLNVQKSSEFMLDDFYTAPADASVNKTILDDNKKELKAFVKTFEARFKEEGFKFTAQVDFDEITASINQAVVANKIDLIIMGTNGASGAAETIFGSNTIKVIRNVDTPVLTIPDGYRYAGLETVLFSSQSGQNLSFSKAKPLLDILALKEPTLKVLELINDSNNVKHDTCFAALFNGISYQSFELNGIPTGIEIDAFIQLNPVEMHAMFVPKESFLDRLLFGSDTAKISYGSQVPLLIMHTR